MQFHSYFPHCLTIHALLIENGRFVNEINTFGDFEAELLAFLFSGEGSFEQEGLNDQ